MDDDRPPLVPYVWEEIAKSLHDVDTTYWAQLRELRVDQPTSPMPPKLPEHLRIVLGLYATRLFLTESNEYPASPKIEFWFSRLADRVLARVMRAVETLDSPPILATVLGIQHKYGLSWHGLTQDEMHVAIQESLDEVRNLTLVRYQTAISQETKTLGTLPINGICEPSLTSEPDKESSDQIGSTVGIVEYRRKLLEDYKAATGNPTNQRIYQSSNSGIYKPQFYEWRDGRLPEKSKITKRFEYFLKTKRLPVPRNSTS